MTNRELFLINMRINALYAKIEDDIATDKEIADYLELTTIEFFTMSHLRNS